MNLPLLRTLSFLTLASMPGIALGQTTSANPPDLLGPVLQDFDPSLRKRITLRRGRRVAVDFDLLNRAQPGQKFRVKFFEEISYVCEVTKREAAEQLENGYHVHGTLA